jgi:hypothetical protein
LRAAVIVGPACGEHPPPVRCATRPRCRVPTAPARSAPPPSRQSVSPTVVWKSGIHPYQVPRSLPSCATSEYSEFGSFRVPPVARDRRAAHRQAGWWVGQGKIIGLQWQRLHSAARFRAALPNWSTSS